MREVRSLYVNVAGDFSVIAILLSLSATIAWQAVALAARVNIRWEGSTDLCVKSAAEVSATFIWPSISPTAR